MSEIFSAESADMTGSSVSSGDPGSYRFTILGTDTDYHDRLHLSSLFSFMQEAAYHNARTRKIGSAQLDERGLCWFLIRNSVRLYHLPHWGETITVDTWARGTRQLTFLRDYEFFDQSGQIFGAAASEWVIASKDTHRPQRPELVLPPDYRPDCTREVFSTPCARLGPMTGPEASLPILTQYADYSDIDRNKHVNNTRYIAWGVNAVHAASQNLPEPHNLQISGLDIHYVNEVRLGTKIHCFCQAVCSGSPGEFLVEARRAADDVPVFRARVLTF